MAKAMQTLIVEFNIDQKTHRIIPLDEFDLVALSSGYVYWIHCDLSREGVLNSIAQKIDLPDEVVQLCRGRNVVPKIIDMDSSVTLMFQCLKESEFKINKAEHFDSLIMYLSDRICFTAAKSPLPALIEFQNDYQKSVRFAKTPCFILFLILDNIVNDFAQFLFNFEIVSEKMDLKVREEHENAYGELVAIKRRVMEIKRSTVAIREILMRLSGRKIAVISDDCRAALINLFNQSQMIFHEIDSIRDMLNALLNQIDYMLMHKMNESIRILTAFAAIFLPLTLITGIYGMNFANMPELNFRYGYYVVLLSILLCGSGLYYYFKRKNWF